MGNFLGTWYSQCYATVQVVILCFAVFYGGSSPSNPWSSHKHAEYATTAGKLCVGVASYLV